MQITNASPAQRLTRTKPLALSLFASLGVIVLFALWPQQTPVLETETQPESSITIPIYQDNTATATLSAPAGQLTSARLFIPEKIKTPADTVLKITVSLYDTTGALQTQRRFDTTLSDIRTARPGLLQLRWQALPSTPGSQFSIIVSAPNLTAEQALLLRPQRDEPDAASVVLLAAQPTIIAVLHYINSYDTTGEDIYYSWLEGATIVRGGNPYACVRTNTCYEKPPVYFPLFYWASAAAITSGLDTYPEWIGFWRPILLLATLGTGLLVMTSFITRSQALIGVAAALLILFNRWSLYTARVGQTDPLALLFLVGALLLLRRKPADESRLGGLSAAMLLLGVSLAIKQVAIFLVPLFLIQVWQTSALRRLRRTAFAAALIAAPVLLSSLPFIVDDPGSLPAALAYAAERYPSTFGAPPLGAILSLSGAENTRLMLSVLALIYAAAWRYRLPVAGAAVMVTSVYLSFYAVNFHQYFVWLIPLFPLMLTGHAAAVPPHRRNQKHKQQSPHQGAAKPHPVSQ